MKKAGCTKIPCLSDPKSGAGFRCKPIEAYLAEATQSHLDPQNLTSLFGFRLYEKNVNCRWIEKTIDLSIKNAIHSPPLVLSKLLEPIMIDMMPLEDRVLTALEQNPYLTHRNLRFETQQGRVTLRGVVGTYFQKQMAQESLRHIEGVAEITNELEVAWA